MYSDATLKSEIIAEVTKEWHEHGAPLLLSQLGLARLSDNARDYIHANAISLKRFIRATLADQVRFVPLSRQGGGLVPAAETNGITDETLEQAYERSRLTRSLVPRRMRFSPDIWDAFSQTIPEGKRWLVDLAGTAPSLRLADAETQPSAGELVIEADDTAAYSYPDAAPDPRNVKRAIAEWAKKNGVELSRLEAEPVTLERMPSSIDPVAKTARPAPKTVGLIDALKSLPKDQLEKIQLPGDVVLSLLEAVSPK